MSTEVVRAVYWDASAILSVLLRDKYSDQAAERANSAALHLLSTLGWAEVLAVIARIERERALAQVLVAAARETFEEGPWWRLSAVPEWNIMRDLSSKWPLRGADLWHLAVAKSLQSEIPELTFFSFDSRVVAAAQGEGL